MNAEAGQGRQARQVINIDDANDKRTSPNQFNMNELKIGKTLTDIVVLNKRLSII